MEIIIAIETDAIQSADFPCTDNPAKLRVSVETPGCTLESPLDTCHWWGPSQRISVISISQVIPSGSLGKEAFCFPERTDFLEVARLLSYLHNQQFYGTDVEMFHVETLGQLFEKQKRSNSN